MKSNSCFPFFFYTGEESLFVGHPCEVLEVDRHANLLEQKRPLLHEGLKICCLVNLFTLGVVGALHKTFYLDWAEVSLFTEQLHFVFLLLLAFCSRTHWHEFHVPLYAAICVLNSCPLLSWNFLCVSYSSDPCLCFIILGTEDRFTFSIRPCNCLTNEWYPDHTISPYMTVDTWQPIFFLATSVEAVYWERHRHSSSLWRQFGSFLSLTSGLAFSSSQNTASKLLEASPTEPGIC